MQIFLADLMERPDNAALQDRPETLNRVRVDRANDVLADGVIDRLMVEAVLQPRIAGERIGAKKAHAVRDGLPNESLKRETVCPINDASNDVAFAFDGANDCRLAGIAPAPRSALFVPMPVLVVAVDVGFVNLDYPAELLDVLDQGGSDFVAHQPSSLVRAESEEPLDLQGAHALLAYEHQMRNSEPIFERLIRVLKNCAGQVRETIAVRRALAALPMMTGRQSIDLGVAAARAYDLARPSTDNEITNAIVLSLKQRIELRCGHLMDGFRALFAGHCGFPHSTEGISHA